MNEKHLLIVCPKAFRSCCERYAGLKRNEGIKCEVVEFDHPEVRDRYLKSPRLLDSLGVDKRLLDEPASCLKVLIGEYFVYRQTRYVLLAGDVDCIPVPWFEFEQSGQRYF